MQKDPACGIIEINWRGVLFLQQIKTFFVDSGKALIEQKQTVARLLVVFCLLEALAFHFSQAGFFTSTHRVSVSKGQTQDFIAAQAGVGGGSLPEGSLDLIKGQDAASIFVEAGALEPEAFSKPQPLMYTSYAIQKGDIIGDLAAGFGLNQDTIISINGIKKARLIQIGQVLRIPNQDGILYTVKKSDTLAALADKFDTSAEAIRVANELFSDTALPCSLLFIPNARLDWMERQEINGDLFIWPASGFITSYYGYRKSPFGDSGTQFHTGIDIGAPGGAPVRAAMSGRVSAVGYSDTLGNHAVITHHSGYRTMYGHMSVVRVKSGAYVGAGERIGDVGRTGLTTGNHLHFTVYKNGRTVNPRMLMR